MKVARKDYAQARETAQTLLSYFLPEQFTSKFETKDLLTIHYNHSLKIKKAGHSDIRESLRTKKVGEFYPLEIPPKIVSKSKEFTPYAKELRYLLGDKPITELGNIPTLIYSPTFKDFSTTRNLEAKIYGSGGTIRCSFSGESENPGISYIVEVPLSFLDTLNSLDPSPQLYLRSLDTKIFNDESRLVIGLWNETLKRKYHPLPPPSKKEMQLALQALRNEPPFDESTQPIMRLRTLPD